MIGGLDKMNTNTMLKSKWYLVEMFTAKKAFRITVRKPLDTKTEALAFENSRVKAHNHKSLLKLINEGYTDLNLVNDIIVDTVKEITPETIVEAVKPIEIKQEFNPEVEEAIRQNYIKKAEKKGVIMYKGASKPNEYSDAVKAFLSTPPSQPSVKPFDYSKQVERYEKRGRVRAEKALAEQMAEYREV